MSLIQTALLAGGLSLAFMTGALAQPGETGRTESAQPWNFDTIPESTGVVMATTNGAKPAKMKIGKKGHAAPTASKPTVEMPAKTMIYKKDGLLYLVTEKKLPDSTYLFDQAKGSDAD